MGSEMCIRDSVHWIHQKAKEHDLPVDFVVGALMQRFTARVKPGEDRWFTEGLSNEVIAEKLEALEQLKNDISDCQERGWWTER